MKIFTIYSPTKIIPYAHVSRVSLKQKVSVSAIVVGGTKYGEKQDFIVVDTAEKKVGAVRIGKTSGGHIKFYTNHIKPDVDVCCIVSTPSIGRDCNSYHTGYFVEEMLDYLSFPGTILAKGIIRNGRGQGEHIVAVVPAHALFRIKSGIVDNYYCFDGETVHVK